MKAYHGELFQVSTPASRPAILSSLVVRRRPGHPSQGLLQCGHVVFACALGRGGIRAVKREGDGATPRGRMAMVRAMVRREAGPLPPTRLRPAAIRPRDGWCDASGDRNYNRPVRLPYPAGHERLRRDDHLYDVCLVLDFNLRPRRRGMGSAIFMHLARPGLAPTEGCVAVSRRVMLRLLPHLSRHTVLRVT